MALDFIRPIVSNKGLEGLPSVLDDVRHETYLQVPHAILLCWVLSSLLLYKGPEACLG